MSTIDDFIAKSAEYNFSARELLILSTKMHRVAQNKFKDSEGYEPKVYVSFEEGVTAYGHILDTGATAQEAFEHTQEVHEKPEGWVDNVKNQRFFHSKDVVNHFDKHPMQVKMFKEGSVDRNSLTTSGTINQQARKLSKAVNLQYRVDDLEQRTETLEKELRDYKADKAIKDLESKRTKELLDFEINPKDIAALMKERGHTQKEISEATGKDVRTIKRWWPDL